MDEKKRELRKMAIELMTGALDYWKTANPNDLTSGDCSPYNYSNSLKVELAEKSKLWRVYLDHGVYQTRTLDKYLQYHTLPKYPRWGYIAQTVQYVLKYCPNFQPLKKELELKLQQFEKILYEKYYKN